MALVKSKRSWGREYGTGILFLLPFGVLFILFVLVPVIVALGTSFTNYNMLQTPQFIGITNYVHLFMDDDVFLIAMQNTLVFACITGPIGYILSFLAAWVIDSLGHIPKIGDQFTYENLQVTVTKLQRMRVLEIRVDVLPEAAEDEEQD